MQIIESPDRTGCAVPDSLLQTGAVFAGMSRPELVGIECGDGVGHDFRNGVARELLVPRHLQHRFVTIRLIEHRCAGSCAFTRSWATGAKRARNTYRSLSCYPAVRLCYTPVDHLRGEFPMANRLNSAQVSAVYEKISNWGRWGKEDQRGALNFITDKKRAEAAKLVKSGETVSLALPLATIAAADN